MNNDIRFIFIHDSYSQVINPGKLGAAIVQRKGQPIGCIAYRYDAAKGTFEWEKSIHNPKDNFNRKLAREVATGRLNKHPEIISFSPESPLSCMDCLVQMADKLSVTKQRSRRLNLALPLFSARLKAEAERESKRLAVKELNVKAGMF